MHFPQAQEEGCDGQKKAIANQYAEANMYPIVQDANETEFSFQDLAKDLGLDTVASGLLQNTMSSGKTVHVFPLSVILMLLLIFIANDLT